MKTIAKVIYGMLIALALQINLSASEYKAFYGLELGLSDSNFKDINGNYVNNDVVTYGIRAGAVNDESRMYLSYQYMDAYAGSKNRSGQYQSLTINSEAFTPIIEGFENISIDLFVGAHVGVVNLYVKSPFANAYALDWQYGLQSGILMSLKSNVSWELGYRYSMSNLSEKGNDLELLKVAYGAVNISF